ncbi:MAG: diguanylate cyclase [Candidatus Eremiobacteraeota bacterium]|nr:diguanylate cyclase [Candidatus Eremiobacteraeota bacterium]
MGEAEKKDATTAKITKAYLTYVVMPLWIVPGFGDYLFHRKTKIEKTSGTHESLIHGLMMTSIGVPALMGLLCEVNALAIATFLGAFVVHEALVIWDADYANGRRYISPGEQHCHSFLEVLPFTSLSFMLCVHWDQALALAGIGPEPPRFNVEPKKEPIPPAFVGGLLLAIGLFIALPYAEEFVRCYRSDRTLGPRKRPANPPAGAT